MIRKLGSLVCLAVLFTPAWAGQASGSKSKDTVIQDAKSGVRIVVEKDGKFNKELAPWESMKPKVEPLDDKEEERSVRLFKQEMAKYPAGMLAKFLKTLYLAKTIVVDNYPYGGTYFGTTLFISDEGYEAGFTDQFLESTFHHEFSSLLKDDPKTKFPEKEWDGLRPEGMKYIGYEPVFKNDGTNWFVESDDLFSQGFVDKYSTVSVEEDLNEVASRLFTGGSQFWEKVDKYPRLAKKIRLCISFYNGIDATFTEAYFRTFAKKPGS